MRRAGILGTVLVVTLACAWLTVAKLRITSDLSTLFPSTGDAAALSRWTHAFGACDPAVILVRGDEPHDVAAVAEAVARALREAPSIARVVDRAPAVVPPDDPTLAWAYAGPLARAKLRSIVTPEGMRARLAETRALLLAPMVDAETEAKLARDPLRLAQVPWETRTAELASGVALVPGEPFTADGGRARLVVAEARGSAFDSESARSVVADVERAEAAAARPGVTTELAGGHAIARDTEQMLRRDLVVSGTLSAILAAVAFVATFRRARALVAVLPPLALGTLWTTGIAALLPSGLDAVAVGFAAVVVGVGVDTGVHVYAALLEARRRGIAPHAAAGWARTATLRPTLTAAAVAAVAFASLGFGGLRAMRELGILCGAGELLTAVAILFVTPEIGAWLERGAPPPERTRAWVRALAAATATRGRAAVALAFCALPLVAIAALGWPRPADALVAIRPRGLAPLVAQEHVHALFGGGLSGQWVVLTTERPRADRVAEALEPLAREGTIVGFDAVTTLAPSADTQRARLAERDALDLPSRRAMLEQALRDTGFDPDACAGALAAFAAPSHDPVSQPADALGWTLSRHVARDAGGDTLVATYVRPRGDPAADARARAAILAAAPGAPVTGFYAIDAALRDALSRDLVLVGGVALVVVAVAMRLALRSARAAAIALATLACEVAAVGVAMRLLAVRWHVYDALVLPVLFGVTIDESMFLLHAAREPGDRDAALAAQAPLVAATALTTAAGFAAIVACRFDGLRDLGAVGALGVLAGLLAALVIVPASLRLLRVEYLGDAPSTFDRAILRTAERFARASSWGADGHYVRAKLGSDVSARAIVDLAPLGDVLDLGCGRGQLAILLLEAGAATRVRGVDWDEAKVALAARAAEGLDARFERADMRSADGENANTVLLVDVLHYMSKAEQDLLLARAAERVRPGGRLIVREASTGHGLRSWITLTVERIGTLTRFNRGERVVFRDVARDVVPKLEARGFACTIEPCWRGTPFANVIVVARYRAGSAQQRKPVE